MPDGKVIGYQLFVIGFRTQNCLPVPNAFLTQSRKGIQKGAEAGYQLFVARCLLNSGFKFQVSGFSSGSISISPSPQPSPRDAGRGRRPAHVLSLPRNYLPVPSSSCFNEGGNPIPVHPSERDGERKGPAGRASASVCETAVKKSGIKNEWKSDNSTGESRGRAADQGVA